MYPIPFLMKESLTRDADKNLLHCYANLTNRSYNAKDLKEALNRVIESYIDINDGLLPKPWLMTLHNDIKSFAKEKWNYNELFSDWQNNMIKEISKSPEKISDMANAKHLSWLNALKSTVEKNLGDNIEKHKNTEKLFNSIEYSWFFNPKEISYEKFVDLKNLKNSRLKYSNKNIHEYIESYQESKTLFTKDGPTLDFAKKLTPIINEELDLMANDKEEEKIRPQQLSTILHLKHDIRIHPEFDEQYLGWMNNMIKNHKSGDLSNDHG